MKTRSEQIQEAAIEHFGHPVSEEFIAGAKWADDNPMSKYNLFDTDLIRSQVECILQNAERLTSGNVAHNGNAIKIMAKIILKKFTKA